MGMTVQNAVAIACVTAFLGGCAASGGYPQNPVGSDTERKALAGYFDPKWITLYQAALKDSDRQALRNEIVYGRIAAYDVEFADFQIALSRERALTDAAADSAVAIMGGTGAALAGQAAKSALLGATAAVTGVKGAVDKNMFYDQAMAAMFAQMSANRATILANIDKASTLHDTQYPLTRALIDTAAYREAGSLPGALAATSHDAGHKKDMAIAETLKAFRMKSKLARK